MENISEDFPGCLCRYGGGTQRQCNCADIRFVQAFRHSNVRAEKGPLLAMSLLCTDHFHFENVWMEINQGGLGLRPGNGVREKTRGAIHKVCVAVGSAKGGQEIETGSSHRKPPLLAGFNSEGVLDPRLKIVAFCRVSQVICGNGVSRICALLQVVVRQVR